MVSLPEVPGRANLAGKLREELLLAAPDGINSSVSESAEVAPGGHCVEALGSCPGHVSIAEVAAESFVSHGGSRLLHVITLNGMNR